MQHKGERFMVLVPAHLGTGVCGVSVAFLLYSVKFAKYVLGVEWF